MVTCVELQLSTASGLVRTTLHVEAGSKRLVDLVPWARQISLAFADAARGALQAAGQPVRCRAGCDACCHQLAVLSIPEALVLAEAVATLERGHRQRALAQFAGVVGTLEDRGMVEELLDPVYRDEPPHLPVAIDYERLRLACPLLEQQRCVLYEDRPIACRDQLVTSPPELCWTPRDPAVRKLRLPLSTSALLARATAELTGEEPRLIPLPLVLGWVDSHSALGTRTWPEDRLLEGFLGPM